MLCSVRNATDEEKTYLLDCKRRIKEKGFKVHYFAETSPGDEIGGFRIVMDHCNEILNSRTVHAYFNPSSKGSKYDFRSSLI